jgi:hypothetical protein
MKAMHALAELEKLGSGNDPVFYRPWQEGDEPCESQVSEVVWSAGMAGRDARKIRLDYWGVDRGGTFRLIQNGTLSGMLSERRREHRVQKRFRKAIGSRYRGTHCPTCRRPH